MRKVLDALRDQAAVGEYPQGFYWFPRVNYAQVDRNGNLEVWERGCGNDPDTRSGFVLKVDEQLLANRDTAAFEARFRAAMLPLFNELRKRNLTVAVHRMAALQQELAKLQGDIE